MLSPQEAHLRARIGAYALHAQGGTNTGPARAAFEDRFIRQVDPDLQLPEAERLRRAQYAKKAYYTKLALKSAQARRRRGEKGASDAA
jgi:hypothetical protein